MAKNKDPNFVKMCYDEAVQSTNDDATACKRSAVKLGYWSDPYLERFIKDPDRKAPEINRGTYARVKGVGKFIESFIKKNNKDCQIINLGAGFDTLYWRLVDSDLHVTNYIEVDFPVVTAKKCWLLKRSKALLQKTHSEDGEIRLSATDLHASGFHIVGADLRNLGEFQSKLNDSEISFNLPTLVVTECVLVYLESTSADNLLKFLAETFPSITLVNYEQINITDRFGEVMLQNLRARGCPLAGAEACQSLETQLQRLKNAGFTQSKGWDMVTVYNSFSVAERQRIEAIELLDEQEILLQLLQHYCIVTAANSGGVVLEL